MSLSGRTLERTQDLDVQEGHLVCLCVSHLHSTLNMEKQKKLILESPRPGFEFSFYHLYAMWHFGHSMILSGQFLDLPTMGNTSDSMPFGKEAGFNMYLVSQGAMRMVLLAL